MEKEKALQEKAGQKWELIRSVILLLLLPLEYQGLTWETAFEVAIPGSRVFSCLSNSASCWHLLLFLVLLLLVLADMFRAKCWRKKCSHTAQKHHVSLSYFQVRKKARSEKWVASVYAKRRSMLHVPQVFTGTCGRKFPLILHCVKSNGFSF